ncbi:hypothetical protein PoB_003310200 [Plakobranchus ocellatus]|uniref:Uncharacterized protein n=1 Tax=Plakobranchus ocellatus TaxID=259542 RepID=A0AAV4AI62_9GAST|nr:hypothetical protein PoB_003310200 [Plakobranchus ocellatus]
MFVVPACRARPCACKVSELSIDETLRTRGKSDAFYQPLEAKLRGANCLRQNLKTQVKRVNDGGIFKSSRIVDFIDFLLETN